MSPIAPFEFNKTNYESILQEERSTSPDCSDFATPDEWMLKQIQAATHAQSLYDSRMSLLASSQKEATTLFMDEKSHSNSHKGVVLKKLVYALMASEGDIRVMNTSFYKIHLISTIYLLFKLIPSHFMNHNVNHEWCQRIAAMNQLNLVGEPFNFTILRERANDHINAFLKLPLQFRS